MALSEVKAAYDIACVATETALLCAKKAKKMYRRRQVNRLIKVLGNLMDYTLTGKEVYSLDRGEAAILVCSEEDFQTWAGQRLEEDLEDVFPDVCILAEELDMREELCRRRDCCRAGELKEKLNALVHTNSSPLFALPQDERYSANLESAYDFLRSCVNTLLGIQICIEHLTEGDAQKIEASMIEYGWCAEEGVQMHGDGCKRTMSLFPYRGVIDNVLRWLQDSRVSYTVRIASGPWTQMFNRIVGKGCENLARFGFGASRACQDDENWREFATGTITEQPLIDAIDNVVSLQREAPMAKSL